MSFLATLWLSQTPAGSHNVPRRLAVSQSRNLQGRRHNDPQEASASSASSAHILHLRPLPQSHTSRLNPAVVLLDTLFLLKPLPSCSAASPLQEQDAEACQRRTIEGATRMSQQRIQNRRRTQGKKGVLGSSPPSACMATRAACLRSVTEGWRVETETENALHK